MSDGDWYLGETDTIHFTFLDPNATTAATIARDPSTTVKIIYTPADGTAVTRTFGVDAVTRVTTGDYATVIQATQAGSLEVRGEAYNGTTLIVHQQTYTVLPSAAYSDGTYP